MKTITIHYQPILIGIVIIVSILLPFWISHATLTVLSYDEIKREQVACEYFKQGECTEVYYSFSSYCSWSLVMNQQECYFNDHYQWLLLGLVLSITFSFIWFSIIFWVVNDQKKLISVRWIK